MKKMPIKSTPIKRGDIFWVDFDPSKGTEIQKKRPALICSPDVMNEFSSRVIVAPITSNLKKIYSFEFALKNPKVNLVGKIMFDQMRSIDKSRLGNQIDSLTLQEMQEIDNILKLVLGIP